MTLDSTCEGIKRRLNCNYGLLTRLPDRWQMPPDDTSSLDNISAELYQPLQNFKSSCEFLSTQMPYADFVNILRKLYTGIEDWHMRNIIAPNRLSEDATQQLRKDLELGLWKMGRRWISKPENFTRR